MLSRRSLLAWVAVLVAVVVGCGVILAVAGPGAPRPRAAAPDARPTEAAAPVRLRIGSSRSQVLRVTRGRPVRVVVSGADAPDVVSIEGLDQQAQISPELPAVFDLLPDRTGTFRLRLLVADQEVGALRVAG